MKKMSIKTVVAVGIGATAQALHEIGSEEAVLHISTLDRHLVAARREKEHHVGLLGRCHRVLTVTAVGAYLSSIAGIGKDHFVLTVSAGHGFAYHLIVEHGIECYKAARISLAVSSLYSLLIAFTMRSLVASLLSSNEYFT